jgi:P4 family phage/plasmid primase-like protien
MMASQLSNEQKDQVYLWISRINCDIAACDSRNKDPSIEQWGNNILDEIDYEGRLEQGFYDKGIAIICGLIRRGPYKGKYISVLDFDNLEAFQKFCDLLGVTLQQLAHWTRVEWHKNPGKIHVFLMTDRPFRNMMTGNGLEVYAQKKLVFVSPSIHRDGNPYSVYDTESIVMLDNVGQMRIEGVLEAFMSEIGCSYLDEDAKDQYIEYLERPDTILTAGQRHYGLKTLGSSWFNRYTGEWSPENMSDDQRLQKLLAYNNIQCSPPKPEPEVLDIWEWVKKTFTGSRQEQRDKREDQGQTGVEEDKRPLVEKLAQTIMEQEIFVTAVNKSGKEHDSNEMLYWYNGKGLYLLGQEWRIKEQCQKMESSVKTEQVKEVINYIKRSTYVDREQFDSSPYIRNIVNGLLDLNTKELKPHRSNYLSQTQLPIEYLPEAKCPSIDKFLSDVLKPEDIKYILQLIGYCLLNDCRFQVSVMLYGNDGANGKGTLLDLVTIFLGTDNCSHRSLQSIDNNRFAVADLYGKMANTYADLKTTKLSETGNFKMLVTGDWITGEFKMINSFKFRNKAKLWFSANEIPESDDKTDAYYRRWLIFHFDKRFIGGNENVNLINEITTPEELSGLLNLALKGLDELMQEGGFHYKTIEEVRKDYEIHTNDVNAFLNEECLVDITNIDYTTLATDAYAAYVNFCVKRETRPLDMNPFGKKLADKGIYNQRHKVGGQSEHYYDGMILIRSMRDGGQDSI